MPQLLWIIVILMLQVLPAASQAPNFPQTMPASTVYGRSAISSGPGQAIPFSTLAQLLATGGGGVSNLWTVTQTFAPALVSPAIIVNAPNGETTEAAVTINKGTGGKAALEIRNAVDNSGRLLSLYAPGDIANDTPTQYFTTGGFLTKLFIAISGISTGAGPSYNISLPSGDASMLAIYADVAKGAQIRCGVDSLLNGGASISTLNTAGFYTGSVLCDGTIAWGSTSNATFTGQDTFLGRGASAALLQLGGPDSGSPVAQTLSATSVSAPIQLSAQFLYGTVFHFAAGVPVGVANGQTVTITGPPGDTFACLPGTVVTNVNGGANTVTVNQFCNPYPGDVFAFNGVNPATLTNQLGSTRLGYGSLPTSIVPGQLVTDVTNPTAFPGGTVISSIDTSAPPGSGGAIFVILNNPVDGTVFQPGGGHDTVQFATPNTAAADLTIAGAKGTGTGAGGRLIFSYAPAGGAGSSQNALTNVAVFDPAAVNKITFTGATSINGAVQHNGSQLSVGGGAIWADASIFIKNNTGISGQTNAAACCVSLFAYDASNNIIYGAAGSGGNMLFIPATGNSFDILNAGQSQHVIQFTDSTNPQLSFGTNSHDGKFTFADVTATTGDTILSVRDGAARGGSLRFGTSAGSYNVGIAHTAAGELDVTDGSTTFTNVRDIGYRTRVVKGTAPTKTGTCPVQTPLGGNTSGSFVLNGACAGGTVILTFATTAPTDWACQAWDRTTPANIFTQTGAASTTTATLTGSGANGDLIAFDCGAF